MPARAYIAGPTVFHVDAAVRFAEITRLCRAAGLESVVPIDDGPMLAFTDKREAARMIRAENMRKIQSCDVVLADVTPFRGPNADDGTAWEMGYGEALGKLVVAYSADAATGYRDRVAAGNGQPLVRDSERELDAGGLIVEDFGLTANLMLAASGIPVQPSLQAAIALAVERLSAA